MELTLLHLYPDLMGLYGEYANLAVLKRHLEAIGVHVTLRAVEPEDRPDFAAADMIYMGAGTERSQKAALTALLPYRDELKAALDRGAVVLFTGSAMELLGQSVTDAAGKVWTGLDLAGYATRETDRRDPGDVIAVPTLWDSPAVGFMNKCSVTTGVDKPLFSVLALGFGNEREGGPEGYTEGNLFATHITGPVLVKNPDFLDLILTRLLAGKEWELPGKLPVLPYEREAWEVTLRELQGRIRGEK